MFTFLKNALNLGLFTHAPVPQSKLVAEFFENRFFPATETGGQKYNLLYQNSVRKYEVDLKHGYLYFVWFVIFLNVMALKFKITSEKMG